MDQARSAEHRTDEHRTDIGIGSYALFWEGSDRNPDRLSIADMIDRAAQLACDVFQICDDPRIEDADADELAALRERAEHHGLRLELGTRTIDPDHLARYLAIARALDARVLRSMIQTHEVAGGIEQAITALRATLPLLESAGIALALETYEQLPTEDLLRIVRSLDSPLVGVCLDPGNCVSALEHPDDVIDAAAPFTLDLHVKDFRFARQEGWVGFTFSGARMGEGLLDLDHELDAVYRGGRRPAAIAEHWLPWQGDAASTITLERDWTEATLAALRARR
ncbi:sugar phosphate isomerase/epimerase [Brachybacterium sp. MASK1Z-5]|uniref:Sugar phosphate isomerase/epimerase n=1 Tax=Brachybacterium halotolerans TaxID=2795215 RepID=A0ABS1BFS6_9MICO|nr:sugar phosphate isomerase/epimerase [Brachybacterium halotolerans]